MPVAETQDLLDRKFDVCFTHADWNGNGVIEQADVFAVAIRVVISLGEPMGSTKTQELLVAFENFWNHVSGRMDTDGDGEVTPEEWRKGLKSFAEDLEAYRATFYPLAKAIFTICDRDNDHSLEQSEFAKFHQAFGCNTTNSQLAFQKLDSDGSGELTVDELLTAWEQYYTSSDPNSPGNWLYGDVWDDTVVVGSKTR